MGEINSTTSGREDTHRKNEALSLFATHLVCPRRELYGSSHDCLGQLLRRATLKGSLAKEEFKDANAQAPVIHVPRVAFACIEWGRRKR